MSHQDRNLFRVDSTFLNRAQTRIEGRMVLQTESLEDLLTYGIQTNPLDSTYGLADKTWTSQIHVRSWHSWLLSRSRFCSILEKRLFSQAPMSIQVVKRCWWGLFGLPEHLLMAAKLSVFCLRSCCGYYHLPQSSPNDKVSFSDLSTILAE